MSTPETRPSYKLTRRARNAGITALIAASIGGYALYQRSSVSAQTLNGLQLSPVTITADATSEATPDLGLYRDGEYQGDSARAGHWGNVQVTAVIENGKLTNFKINDYPHSRSMSVEINQYALPYLMQEAVTAQNTSVDMISGATLTSEAFIQSLQSALDQAATSATLTPTPTATLGAAGTNL